MHVAQHSINKSKILLGFVGPQWEQRIVSELDSAMNQWIDSIPEHRASSSLHSPASSISRHAVRWDPNREDLTFFDQSATLYTAYYQLQITIHKPFIKARRNPVTSFPSLAICTNAARACTKVVHTHISRLGRTSTEQIVRALPWYLDRRATVIDVPVYYFRKRHSLPVSCCCSAFGMGVALAQWSTQPEKWQTSISA
jgi:hypothetical protein